MLGLPLEEFATGRVAFVSAAATACMYACAFASVVSTMLMSHMLYNSRVRAAARVFMAEAGAGLLLAMSFVLTVLFDPSGHEFTFPVTAFTLSMLLLFSRLTATAATAANFLAAPPMPVKAWRRDPRRHLLRAFAVVLAGALVPIVTLASHFTDRKSAPGCLLPSNSDIQVPHSGELPHDFAPSLVALIAVFAQLAVVAAGGAQPMEKHISRARLAFTSLGVNSTLVFLLLVFPRVNSENLTPWVKSFGWAVHEGDWCSTLFVTVSMFFLVVGLATLIMSAYGIRLTAEMDGISKAHALYAETATLAVVPPLLIIALGRMELEYKVTFLVNAVPQLALLTLPYAAYAAAQMSTEKMTPLL